jgi:hypothetical protein
MARPAGGYKIDDVRVPGVTTITGRFKDSGGLLHWAWEQGRDGKDFRETRDAAADAGTACHEMIECDWRGEPFDGATYKPEVLAKAEHAFLAYLEWKQQTKLTVLHAELTLLSKIHRFGGTLDAIMVNGKLRLGDYKTSNGVYADMLVQVAGGYSLLWRENYPDQPLDGMELIRFSKPKEPDDPISFSHHYWSAEIFPLCEREFLLFREAYDLDKRIGKLF